MGAMHLPLPLCQRRILTLRRRHGSSLARQHYNEPCGASIVAHFARKVRGTNLWRIMQRIQLSPHFHLRAPHFASKVSYSASPQWATMLRRSVPNPCQRTQAVQRPSLGRATSASGPCAVRLWDVQRPPLGRATTVSGPCDERLWAVRRTNTVPRSPSNRSFVPKHPFSALSPRRAALFFYFHPTEKANADDNSR